MLQWVRCLSHGVDNRVKVGMGKVEGMERRKGENRCVGVAERTCEGVAE